MTAETLIMTRSVSHIWGALLL